MMIKDSNADKKQKALATRASFPWILISAVAAFMLSDIALAPGRLLIQYVEWDVPTTNFCRQLLEILFIGSIAGQLCFLAVLAGLWGRSWIAGYLLAVLLICIAAVGMQISETAAQQTLYDYYVFELSDWVRNFVMTALFFPFIVFAAAAPVLMMRPLAGWRLHRDSKASLGQPVALQSERETQSSGGVSGLLIVTALTAGAIMNVKSAETIFARFASGAFWSVLVIGGVLAVAIAVAALPAIRVAFRYESNKGRLLALLSLAGAGILLSLSCVAIASIPALNAFGLSWSEVLSYGIGIPLVGSSVFILGLYCLRWSGYQLLSSRGLNSASLDPAEESSSLDKNTSPTKSPTAQTPWVEDELEERDELHDIRKRDHRRHCLLAACTLGLFAIGPICGAVSIANRKARAGKLASWHQEITGLGGGFEFSPYGEGDTVYKIDLPPELPIAWMERLGDLSNVNSLSLRNRVIDFDNPLQLAEFSSLRKLDLSGCTLDDATLGVLEFPKTLSSIDVSSTQVSLAGIQTLVERPTAQFLGIAEIELDWNDLIETLAAKPYLGLRVGGPSLTNEKVQSLMKTGYQFSKLDLSGSPIDARAFDTLPTTLSKTLEGDEPPPQHAIVRNLVLDDTPFTVSDLRSVIERLPYMQVDFLSIANTSLPDELLIPLSSLPLGRVNLSGNPITDEGLSQISPAKWGRIVLQVPELKGQFLEAWQNALGAVQRIDLSDTSVDDSALKSLRGNLGLQELNLARTKITSRGLNTLFSSQQFTLLQIDIRDCQIDVDEVTARWISAQVFFGFGEYSQTEMKKWREIGQVYPGAEMMDR